MSEQMTTDKTITRNPARLAALALGMIAVLFISINLFASSALTSWRIDLTESRMYTLSDATRNVLAEIDEPITIRFFYSKTLAQQVPTLNIYAQRVTDMLNEYVNASDGKIILEVYDPQPFSEIEDRAVSLGLQGVPVGNGTSTAFFGLVASNTTDDVAAIPFIQTEREGFLEYDLSKMIWSLAKLDPPVVGILSGLSINGGFRINPQTGRQEMQQPFAIYNQINELFETRVLPQNTDRIPDDITALLVIQPDEFGERTLFAIDQYVLGGGKVLAFVDPHSEISQDPQANVMKALEGDAEDGTPTFATLMKAWGVTMDKGVIVGDRFAARRVNAGATRRPVPYIPWLMLRGNNINRDLPITADIETMALASAGILRPAEGATTELTPLFRSSPGSMAVKSSALGQRPNPQKLLQDYKAGSELLTMAARLSGPVKTAFPEGQPALKEQPVDQSKPPATFDNPLTESSGAAEVIIVSDVDMLADHFWIQYGDFFGRQVPTPVANNGDFVVNTLEAFSGSSELMSLRGRTSVERPFTVIQKLQNEADAVYEKKERELKDALADAEKKLQAIRGRGGTAEGLAAILSEEDRREIQTLQRSILKIRSDLRAVQRSLDLEVQKLESKVLFYNVAAVPLAVAFLAIVLSLVRSMRRRKALAAVSGGN